MNQARKVERYEVETESGTKLVGVRTACFGAWVSVSPKVGGPWKSLTRIVPVTYVPRLQDIGALVG